jgi:hypothetical protein
MNFPQLALLPAADTTSRLYAVAQSLHQRWRSGEAVTRQSLKRLMVEAFGSDDADGIWSMRDAYDALEAAQVLMLASPDCPLIGGVSPADTFAKLTAFEGSCQPRPIDPSIRWNFSNSARRSALPGLSRLPGKPAR